MAPTFMRHPMRAASLVLASALAMSLAACSGGGGNTGAGKTITVVIAEYSKDHTKAFWDSFKTKYEATTSYKINLQIVSWDDLDRQSSTMVQNGNAPDILNENAYAIYAKDNLLWSSDDVLPESVKSDILPSIISSGTYNGKFYGFPDLASARALFYNKDLFAKVGIANPPTTWDEFIADAQKVSALGDGSVGYGLAMGPVNAQEELAIWLFNNGGQYKDGNSWVMNSTKNVQTLQFLKDLANKYKVTQSNPGNTNHDDGTFPLFEQGKAGMVIGFGPLSQTIDTQYKDIHYGIAPMPTNDGKAARTYGITDYLMAFKNNGSNKDAVKAFYNLYYQPDQINTWIKSEGFLPVTQSGIKAFADVPSQQIYLQMLPNIMFTPQQDPKYNTVKNTIQNNVGTVMSPSGPDPKKFLDDLQKQVESVN